VRSSWFVYEPLLSPTLSSHKFTQVLVDGVVLASVVRAGAKIMLMGYGDAKVANRDTKVWHGATEKGP
jgi:hypothetical protein